MDEATALVQTIDIITPVVDDPYDFGFIAAVNAMSDVYAMGGTPLTAMSFLGFDKCDLPVDIAAIILEGAKEALKQMDCTLLGGHTLEDPEIKFGLAVTGTISRDQIFTKGGAQDGDLIYLTKPLGTGIISTALKGEMLSDETLRHGVKWMKTSNGPASEVMKIADAHAATDVTGFGLLGHLWEMCSASNLGAYLNLPSIPLMDGADGLVDMGMVPAGAYDNRDFFKENADVGDLSDSSVLPLYDPQTSGGLLIAVQPDHADILELQFSERDIFFRRIGIFTADQDVIKVVSS